MKKIIFFLLLVNVSFINPFFTYAQSEINWSVTDHPPYMIIDGTEKGLGSADLLRDFFIERMPEYTHYQKIVNNPRFMAEAKSGNNWCHPFLLKTDEREEFLYYSTPLSILLPNQLIIHRNNILFSENRNSISLEEVFKNKKYSGIIEQERAYGKNIDALINKYESVGSFTKEQIPVDNILNMLLLGRVDYTINYTEIIQYFSRELQIEDQYISIPIREEPAIQLVYFSCPKTPWGLKVINRINEIFDEEKNNPEYIKLITEMWVDDNSSRILKETYNELLLK